MAYHIASMGKSFKIEVEVFMDTYYIKSRLDRYQGCRESLIEDRFDEFRGQGTASISHHDSTTGEYEVLYDPQHPNLPNYVKKNV